MRKMIFKLCIIAIGFSGLLHAQQLIPGVKMYQSTVGFWEIPSRLRVNAPDKQADYLFFIQEILSAESIRFVKTGKSDLHFIHDDSLPSEAYELTISTKYIRVKASNDAGFFYALQTLSQLRFQSDKKGAIKCANIKDTPNHRWRTFMLDSGRQYQHPNTIKKYLDMMALLKMNTFHWHLTEGLGWRVEIKKYPDLASKGSEVAKGHQQQGFYTQNEIKDIIAYAAKRYITIIPEIDMPGHAEAALSVYPHLGCFNEPVTIPETGFTHQIFCAGKPQTLDFLRDVLDEVCDLFPSAYIHLGGDEALKANWDACPDCQGVIQQEKLKDSHDLQIWFSNQMAAYLHSKGRKAIFWDDVIAKEGNLKLTQHAAIHWWNFRARKYQPLEKALELGYEILCGTNVYNYLNFPLTPWKGYKQNRTFDIQDAYERNPSNVKKRNPLLLGMSCSMWTDYVVLESMLDQRLFPRILALAHQMWYSGDNIPFEVFYQRVNIVKPWFEQKGYEFGPGLKSEVPEHYSWGE